MDLTTTHKGRIPAPIEPATRCACDSAAVRRARRDAPLSSFDPAPRVTDSRTAARVVGERARAHCGRPIRSLDAAGGRRRINGLEETMRCGGGRRVGSAHLGVAYQCVKILATCARPHANSARSSARFPSSPPSSAPPGSCIARSCISHRRVAPFSQIREIRNCGFVGAR